MESHFDSGLGNATLNHGMTQLRCRDRRETQRRATRDNSPKSTQKDERRLAKLKSSVISDIYSNSNSDGAAR